MKISQIALKDLRRAFRSAFLLVMMFVAPLMITGLLYFAFGNASGGSSTFSLPVTRVRVANLDQRAPGVDLAAGQLLVQYLQSEQLAGLFQTTLALDEASARAAVERREADVALIIPPNFSAAVVAPGVRAAVTLYHDPVQTVGPRVLGTAVGSYLDGFSGSKIAAEVTDHQLAEKGLAADPQTVAGVAERYAEWAEVAGHDSGAGNGTLVTRSPLGEGPGAASQNLFLAPMMAGMLLLFVFFTGAATAQSIIYEDEEGTLARLFTTPTSRATILAGKFAGVLVVLVAQATVLMFASRVLFGINWGRPEVIVLLTAGTSVVAGGVGVFLMSFVRTTRQAGLVLGTVVPLTGILGGLVPTGDPAQPSPFETLGLALPQGWAMRGWRLALGGAEAGDVLLSLAVLLVVGGALLAAGTVVFRRRLA